MMEETALIDQRPVMENFLQQCPQNLSGFSFVNLFAWQGFWHYEFRTIHENLCIFARNHLGIFLYLPPLGKAIFPGTIDAAFDIMDGINTSKGYSHIENVSEHLLGSFPQGRFQRYLKGYEYCYYRKDIVGLKGTAYKSKRCSCNYFIKNTDFEYLPFTEDMIGACTVLYDEWAHERQSQPHDDVYSHMLTENQDVHGRVMQHASALGMTGRVVKVNGRIRAYTFGYPINEDVFCILFEIADLNVKGLPVFIFREFCADPALQKYRFINVMDDFGMDQIARTKLSFRPCILFPCYVITKNTGS